MAFTVPRTWTDGELVTKAIMDPHVRDNFLAMGPHLIARRTTNQSVTSSTVFVSDDTLQLTVATNEVWNFKFVLRYDAGGTGDLKVSFSIPASAEVDAWATTPSNATGVYQDASWQSLTTTDSQPFVFTGAGAGVNRILVIEGLYVGAGTAGTFILRWAQGASDATATRMLTHSTLWAVKLA